MPSLKTNLNIILTKNISLDPLQMFLYIVGLLWGLVSPFIFRNYAAMKSKNRIRNGEFDDNVEKSNRV
jgi:hypothetical protein